MKRIAFIPLILGSYYYLFFIGVFITLRGLLLPQIKDDFNITYTLSGLWFFLPLIPGVLGTLFSGYIFSKYNKKYILLITSFITSLFFLMLPFSTNYFLFLFFSLVMAFGSFPTTSGSYIVISDVFTAISPKYRDNAINLAHFCFSFGAVLFLLFFNIMVKQNINWRNIIFVVAILFSGAFLFYFLSRYPKEIYSEKGEKINFEKMLSLMMNKKLMLYSLSILLCTGTEISLVSWVTTYLENGYSLSKEYCSFIFMLYFLFFFLGRFIGIFAIKLFMKIKYLCLLIILVILSFFLGFILRIRIFNIDIFISLCGLFISLLYPIIQNFMIRDFKDNLSAATGIFVAAGTIGGTFLTLVIGFFNDIAGDRYGIYFILMYLIPLIPVLITNSRINLPLKESP